MPHHTEIKVRFSELDPYNHVNHAVYITYFEVARTEALSDAGVSIERVGAAGFQFIVVGLTAKFYQPAVAGDTLVVQTWLAEVARASSTWMQRIVRDDVLLTTQELRVCTANSSGRPVRPPQFVLDGLTLGYVTEPPD